MSNQRHSIIVIALVVTSIFLALPAYAQWSEPSAAPPGGTVAAPINVSSNSQTKSGSLTINPGNFYLGQSAGTSKFCLNADPVGDINNTAKCIADWADIGGVGKFVRLNPQTPIPYDTGFVSLNGSTGGQYTFEVTAPTVNNQFTAGLLARDTTGFSATSYAVYAYTNNTNASSAAIYAQADTSNTYAGYFRGKVAIFGPLNVEGNIQLNSGDVLVGTVQNPGQICLYGGGAEDCIDDWGEVVARLNGELWTEQQITAGVYNTWLLNSQSNVAIGGNGTDKQTEFFFNVSSGGKFALGLPTASAPQALTCQDGVCNGSETSASCPQDCKDAPPDLPGNIKNLAATRNGTGNNLITWQNPANTTFSGVLLVRSIGAQPSLPPTDGAAYGNCQTLGNGIIVKITSGSSTLFADDATSCSPPVSGVSYYYRGFAYNSIPKYADGVPAGANANVTTQ